MRENFLHYIWRFKKFNTLNLETINNESVQIVSTGEHNLNTGPDFTNAILKIGNQHWAGNVEIHVKASDWYLHNHQVDKNYDNVILHVVWEHDAEVFRQDNSIIPVLELKDFISKTSLDNYEKLFSKKQKWINCEQDFESIDEFVIYNWLERLYFERLERKHLEVEILLKQSKNNWEEVLFKMLTKNFGLKVNGEAFLTLANSFDFLILQRIKSKTKSLEALFFGQSELLLDTVEDEYFNELKQEYQYLKQKFSLSSQSVRSLQFFRLRPTNFPTIRLSQLAKLYSIHNNLFSKVINAKNKNDLILLFKVSTSKYWESHYTFGKESKTFKKTISNSFIDLLIINTIVPLQFSYAKYQGQVKSDSLLEIIQRINPEKNKIIEKYQQLKPIAKSAMHSQALLQLKNQYCNKNKCLQCEIGNTLLARIY